MLGTGREGHVTTGRAWSEAARAKECRGPLRLDRRPGGAACPQLSPAFGPPERGDGGFLCDGRSRKRMRPPLLLCPRRGPRPSPEGLLSLGPQDARGGDCAAVSAPEGPPPGPLSSRCPARRPGPSPVLPAPSRCSVNMCSASTVSPAHCPPTERHQLSQRNGKPAPLP